jgi:WD40 repeat protein
LAFSPDGRWLAWSEGKTLHFSEAATGRPVQTLLVPNPFWFLSTVAFHPSGRLLVAGHVDGNVSVYDRWMPGLDIAAFCLAVAGPNATNALAHAWRLTAGYRATSPFPAHTGQLFHAAFSPDGKWLATTGGADGRLKVWDVRTWTLCSDPLAHRGGACGVAFSRDGKRLATGGADAVVRIWDWNEGRPVERIALHGHGDTVYSVAFDDTGLRVASGGLDRVVRIWDLGTAFEAAGPHQVRDDHHGK